MSAFDKLRDLANKADPSFEEQVKKYADDHLQKCNPEAAKLLGHSIQRAINRKRRAEVVPALLLEVARLAVESGQPGVALSAYKRILDELFERSMREKGK